MSGADPASTRVSSTEYWSAAFDSRLSHISGITADSSCGDTERAREVIADEIHSLHILIHSARRRSNALVITSRLSPELLVHVFSFLEDTRPYSSCWIRVTHVCHHWREVALHHPYLWSRLTFRLGPRWFAEMVARAKSVPLMLTADGYLPPPFKDPHLIADIIRRVRYLRVASLPTELNRLIPSLAPPLPLLETFAMKHYNSTGDYDPGVASVMPSLFIGRASHLRSFSLRGCQILGTFPPSTHITHLEIEGQETFTTFIHLLRSIENLPQLEVLILHNELFPDRGSSQEEFLGSRIHLSSLRLLSIGGRIFMCEVLLQHLSIPSSASTDITCWYIAENDHLLLDALRLHASNFRADAPFLSIWTYPSEAGIDLLVERCTGNDEADRWKFPHADRSRMRLFAVEGAGGSLLSRFLDVFGHEHIHTVSFEGSPEALGEVGSDGNWSDMDWVHAFEHCLNVQHVRVSSYPSIQTFVLAFIKSSDTTDQTQDAPQFWLFPRLNSMWFDCMLAEPARSVETDCGEPMTEEVKQNFVDSVIARRDTLKTIYTRGSSLPGSLALALSRVVAVRTDRAKGPSFIPGKLFFNNEYMTLNMTIDASVFPWPY